MFTLCINEGCICVNLLFSGFKLADESLETDVRNSLILFDLISSSCLHFSCKVLKNI